MPTTRWGAWLEKIADALLGHARGYRNELESVGGPAPLRPKHPSDGLGVQVSHPE
jgi:hypothetical protein